MYHQKNTLQAEQTSMAEDPAAEALAAARALLTFEFACKLSDLPEGARRCVQLPSSKRSVMLLNLRGQIYCMDQACYRAFYRTAVLCDAYANGPSSVEQTTAGRS